MHGQGAHGWVSVMKRGRKSSNCFYSDKKNDWIGLLQACNSHRYQAFFFCLITWFAFPLQIHYFLYQDTSDFIWYQVNFLQKKKKAESNSSIFKSLLLFLPITVSDRYSVMYYSMKSCCYGYLKFIVECWFNIGVKISTGFCFDLTSVSQSEIRIFLSREVSEY